MTTIGIRGAFFDFTDAPWKHVGREPDAARFHADGLMVIEDCSSRKHGFSSVKQR
jgi:guanine deaminase